MRGPTPVTRLAMLLGVSRTTVWGWIARGLVRRNPDGTLNREDVARVLDTREFAA